VQQGQETALIWDMNLALISVWTPLFLNAAGIFLEVGGVLQHGAVVVREYGAFTSGTDGK